MKVPFHPEFYSGSRFKTKEDKQFFNAVRLLGETATDELDAWDNPTEPHRIYLTPLTKKVLKKCRTPFEVDMCTMGANNEDVMREVMICERFKRYDDKKIYRVNPHFLKALSRMDVEIRRELLPQTEFSTYFSFPPGVLIDHDGDNIIGGYVHMEPPTTKCSQDLREHDIAFRCCAITMGKDSRLSFGPSLTAILGLNFGQKFKAAMKSLEAYAKKDREFQPVHDRLEYSVDGFIFRTLLNATMYIHSMNPDVSHLRPVRELTSREQKEISRKGIDLNNSPYPVILLSWNYESGVEYSKDSTIVSTHLRWQPYGPGWGQTKLIMVREHERHFKKQKEIIDVASSDTPSPR